MKTIGVFCSFCAGRGHYFVMSNRGGILQKECSDCKGLKERPSLLCENPVPFTLWAYGVLKFGGPESIIRTMCDYRFLSNQDYILNLGVIANTYAGNTKPVEYDIT